MRQSYADIDKGTTTEESPILKLGDLTQIRLLEPDYERWLQHDVRGVDAQGRPVYRSVVCLGGTNCPLCAKGRTHFPIKTRYAANVLDRESGKIRLLMGGPSIFKDGFARDSQVGMNVMDYDYVIKKSGSQLNTKYDVIRMDKSPAPAVGPHDLYDTSRYADPLPVEKIFEILESCGIDYDALEVPSYTRDEAAAMPMPFGQYKGQPMGQILIDDPRYVQYLVDSMEDSGDIANDVYLAFTALLEYQQPETSSKPPVNRAEAEGWQDVSPAPVTAPVAEPVAEPTEELLECPECGFKARTKSGLRLHMKSKHQAAGAEPVQAVAAPVAETSESGMTREGLIKELGLIFMTDSRFNDFSKVSEAIGSVKKGAHTLPDLTDDELQRLLVSLRG